MKTNPDKTICDEADALWNTFLLSNHDIECSTVFLKFDEARKVNARRTRNDD